MEKKIVIPSQEEVAEFTGQASADAGPPAVAAGGEAASPPAEDYKDKYLRAVAELSNYRKRAEKDREESVRYANAGFARSLLPVLDNLERVVVSAAEHPENAGAILDGIKMTLESFRKALRDSQVTRIEAEGQPFDPAVHEAMMQQPSEAHEVQTVLRVLEEGYRMHDRVIRPARVIVSAPPAKQDE
jgi:molecular chaperone GrpE